MEHEKGFITLGPHSVSTSRPLSDASHLYIVCDYSTTIFDLPLDLLANKMLKYLGYIRHCEYTRVDFRIIGMKLYTGIVHVLVCNQILLHMKYMVTRELVKEEW